MVTECWESQDGAAIDFEFGTTRAMRSTSRPVLVTLLTEEDGEVELHLSLHDASKLRHTLGTFVARVSQEGRLQS